MELETIYRKTTFNQSIGGKIIGSLFFEETFSNSEQNNLKSKLELLLIYSRSEIMIYSMGGLENGKSSNLKLMLVYNKRIYGSICSVDMLTHPETKINYFSVLLSDGRFCTLKFNTKLFCLETVAMHEINSKEALNINRKHANISTEYLMRIDASKNS